MPFLRKYNTLTVTGTTAIRIPIIKRAVVDFAVSADWTPAAGDVKIAIDGTAPANVANLPTAVASGNGAFWEFILTAAELSCKQCIVTVVDAATKAVEDQSFIVETFGNASAMYQADLSAANLPANATQLAGQTITAAAGVTFPTSVASPTNITAATGVDITKVLGTAISAPATAGILDVNVKNMNNVAATPITTIKAVQGLAVDGVIPTATNLTNAPTNGDLTATMKTSVTTAATAATPTAAAVTGAVGSVTGAVGSVTGSVGSVTGNIGGNLGGTLTATERTAIADALLNRDMSVGTDSGSPTVRTVRQALRFLRNKWSIAAGTLTVTKEDDATPSWTGSVTTTAGNPVSTIDPA